MKAFIIALPLNTLLLCFVVGKRRLHSASSNKRRSDRTTLREAKHVSKTAAMWEKRVCYYMLYKKNPLFMMFNIQI